MPESEDIAKDVAVIPDSRCDPFQKMFLIILNNCTAARTLLSLYSFYSLRMRVGKSQKTSRARNG